MWCAINIENIDLRFFKIYRYLLIIKTKIYKTRYISILPVSI